ncbi:hypothetical protein Pint_32376 [Pistacia integerrima]|uniref:Uncharacterized protein n=1 Tax=Pistacia integerrima TaxID=434235 RepID=A0ACC0XSW5_9ROSI|nr:hypothetical protein Pint_32376 [Pistacia integerrima]
MPATAGRVRMPANNRVHSSAALQTHGIWQSAIGYDPYAPNKDESKNTSQPKPSNDEPDAENPYNSYQGLLALARITNTNADEARGACKKCEAIQAAVLSELDKLKGKVGKLNGKGKVEIEGASEEEEEEESDSSDSDADPEIERIIAERNGKKISSRGRSSRKKKTDVSDEDGTDSNSDSGKRKRGRSKKRRIGKRENSDSEDEDEGGRKRRREKRRKRDRSSDEEDEYRHLDIMKGRAESPDCHLTLMKVVQMIPVEGAQRGLRKRAGNAIMKGMNRGIPRKA